MIETITRNSIPRACNTATSRVATFASKLRSGRVAPSPKVCHATRAVARPAIARSKSDHYPCLRAVTRPRRQLFHSSHQSASAEPTIFALSTAPGRAAIAIIRVSGTACQKIYSQLCPQKRLPKPRYAAVRTLYDQANGVLDSEALVLYFPAPRTVTGEDLLELHVHGGPAVVKAVLAAIGNCSSVSELVRYAEPGEFTRRAFLNDRLDLTKVEALGDTLSAVTEEQRRLSVQGTVSGLAVRYESWRQMLLAARGELEALIDFSEDQHFDESPAELAASVAVQVRSLERLIKYHSSNSVRGELLRNGISLSLIGSPNVGKSSLLNQIVGRNAAIVSQEAGTTRDIVEVGVDLGGFFCRLGDTAGLRSNSPHDLTAAMQSVIGEVEKEGIRRAKEKAMQSDVVILVFSVDLLSDGQDARLRMDDEVLETAKQLIEAKKNIVIVVNKMDQLGQSASQGRLDVLNTIREALPMINGDSIFCLSCKEAQLSLETESSDPGNFQGFVTGLVHTFRNITSPLTLDTEESDTSMWQESLGATERQRLLLDECGDNLRSFLGQVDSASRDSEADGLLDKEEEFDIVVAAESLRAGADCLAKLTGRGEAGDVEEVLGVVFEKFCVGK